MPWFEDYLPPLPDAADLRLAKIELGQEVESLPDAPVILGRFVQLAGSIGAINDAQDDERAVYEAVFHAAGPRVTALGKLAQAAATVLTPELEAAMLGVFEQHPASDVRLGVGKALVGRGSPATLARMASAMELTDPRMVWVRDVGTHAAVRLDPRTAFDRLQPRFERELLEKHSYLARGLFGALQAEAPLDPRWFPFLVRFYAGPDAVVLDYSLRPHPVPAATEAVAALIAERARAGKDWLPYPGHTLAAWGAQAKAAAPMVVEAVGAALRAGLSDYRLTLPLDVLVAMGERSVLPALRELHPLAKRRAKIAFEEALKRLDPEGTTAPKDPKKAAAAKKKGLADPEREALAKVLTDAGFSEARAAGIAALARNRIVLTPRKLPKGKSVGVGQSRFGGDPDLAPGTPWPTLRLTRKAAEEQFSQGLEATPHAVDGAHVLVPLGFVAQLRLEELAPLDTEGKLPPAGLLSFFVRQDIQTGDHGYLFRQAAQVLFTELTEGELTPVAPPPEVQDFNRHRATALRPTRELPLPPPQQAYALDLLAEESSRYDALYPQHVRSSVYGALGLARAAYYLGLPGRGETLLLQLGSGGGTGFGWGDDSSIFFLLADAALKKRDFAKAICVADEC